MGPCPRVACRRDLAAGACGPGGAGRSGHLSPTPFPSSGSRQLRGGSLWGCSGAAPRPAQLSPHAAFPAVPPAFRLRLTASLFPCGVTCGGGGDLQQVGATYGRPSTLLPQPPVFLSCSASEPVVASALRYWWPTLQGLHLNTRSPPG